MRDELPYHLEVCVSGMTESDDGEGHTLADDIDHVSYWDVDLRITLPTGQIEDLLERTYPDHADATRAANILLALFPQAAISEYPEL